MPSSTVLITGAAKRLGRAMAIHYAQKGYHIALHCSTSKADAHELATHIKDEYGVSCKIYVQDFKHGDYKALIARVYQDLPSLSVLINNASVFERAHFLDTEEAFYDAHMDVNFKAPFFLTQAFASICKKGVVVNVLDAKIKQNHSPFFIYLLSKKIFAEFTSMAARELGPDIRVLGLAPGIVLPSEGMAVQRMEERASKLPLRRCASVDDVLGALDYMVQHNGVTGEIMYVDGGERLL